MCLMQLAAGDRTYVVDMLHVCRPKETVVNGDPTMASPSVSTGEADRSSRLTKMEELLEEALGWVLGSPGVVKVGLGPKVTSGWMRIFGLDGTKKQIGIPFNFFPEASVIRRSPTHSS